MKRSLRMQLFLNIILGLVTIVFSMSYVFFSAMELQEIVDTQFRKEQFYQKLQLEISRIRTPILSYLSSRSSKALAELLIREQTLRQMIPKEIPVTTDAYQLAEREIFFMLRNYLDLVEESIAFKRGRSIGEYTRKYEEMKNLNAYLTTRIDTISLSGIRKQLAVYESVIDVSRELQLRNLLMIVFSFLFSLTWMLFSINKVTDPMHRLAQMAGELSAGNFEIEDIHISAVSEVEAVVEAFNDMKNDIRHNIAEIQRQKSIEQGYMNEKLRNLKMEQLLKRMELYTMQAQMNPHFLFNTINTGVQLAIVEDAEKTAEFMEHLATFFRHNIRERKLIVPLRHEIEGLRSYFYILKIRFPKTLDCRLDVPEPLLDSCSVPALILQPLVENSVIHAFKGVHRKGSISVKVWKEGKMIMLSVRDDGIGIAKEMMDSLLKRYSWDQEHTSKVMGLENVIQRLYFFYPDNPDIVTIQSGPDRGTEVVISIDMEEEPCIKF
ncbi:sensor histidine kinase [Sediminispirochaeta bajacaliforniensis]|uniref:sensor histidine kinase n=1 Tax=Sediminispirochaeta bajacaliforniensis TaxID=148 RepID=UPI0003762AA2|nr:histidine kinase [Sediminispirochaeta bajacaliforniensis]